MLANSTKKRLLFSVKAVFDPEVLKGYWGIMHIIINESKWKCQLSTNKQEKIIVEKAHIKQKRMYSQSTEEIESNQNKSEQTTGGANQNTLIGALDILDVVECHVISLQTHISSPAVLVTETAAVGDGTAGF